MSRTTGRRLTFEGSGGRPVRADLHEAASDAPTIVLAHGFKGFRSWGFLPWLAERLCAAGNNALRIDFSHNGVEEVDFDRLDLFLIDTFTRHQEDLRAVVDTIDGPIGLLGHSRGGADVLLFAADEPRVRGVATLAAVAEADASRAFPDAEQKLRTLGYYPVPNARTGQTMPLGRPAFDDAVLHDIEGAARDLADRPLLLVHGTADESVPVVDLDTLAAAHGAAETLRVDGAGHTFGAVHPFDRPGAELERVADTVVSFFGRVFRHGDTAAAE